ncbi:hypothetical protein ABVT39_024887 [Epinephelus coioides]
MKKTGFHFFPGRVKVTFRKGPSGYLKQEPSDEARRIKDNPALQDKSAPQKEELVRDNARKVVMQRGGDLSDKQEVLGEYVIQFGKYRGKSFRWLLQNDVGYTLYLINKVEEEEKAGQFHPEGHSKDSLLSFLHYSRGFKEIEDLRKYLAERPAPLVGSSEDSNLVGFGSRKNNTWGDIWTSRADGYASFIMGKACVAGSKMYKLQQYLLKQSQLSVPAPSSLPTSPPASNPPGQLITQTILVPNFSFVLFISEVIILCSTEMEEDEDLERAMLSLSPTKLEATLMSEPATVPPPAPTYDQELLNWNGSHQQRIWMKTELESLGIWPGSRPVRHLMNMISLWRHPPQPELIDTISGLPSPSYFQFHPFFIWKPESAIMERVRNNYVLPCLHGCTRPHIASSGIGRPRVVVGVSGQYYLFASRLICKACRRHWFADNPQWLCKLPQRFQNILPAVVTYKTAVCKTVMHELRRTGKSPNDTANQVMEMLHLKYEHADLAHLHSVENVRDGEAGLYGQQTISGFIRGHNDVAPFGGYADKDGWCGVSLSAFYLTDCLLHEFQQQEGDINLLLQGTFGQVLRSDHTRKVARKVTLTSGTMSSYAVMNENWMILSWVMVQSESEASLETLYDGLALRYTTAGIEKASYQWMDRDCCAAFKVLDTKPGEHLHWAAWRTTEEIVGEVTQGNLANSCASRNKFNKNIIVKLDLFHCMRRFTRECTSEHHPLYSAFCQFLSAAFTVVDQSDLKKLQDAYTFCGIEPAVPTKQHVREHCRMKIPPPVELVERVEDVL